MKLDTSAAPELDLLARGPGAPAPATVGNLAACLRLLEADPRSWWDLVRFDPDRPVRVPLAAPRPGCEAWLLVFPPGYRGNGQPEPGQPEPGQAEPGPEVACLVAGAILEQASTQNTEAHAQDTQVSTQDTRDTRDTQGRPLLPGRIRVRGRGPRRMINSGSGYAVSLHARALAR